MNHVKKSTIIYTSCRYIKAKILNNEYKIDENIPTERELEQEFGVSKITIRKAIEILESEGYVEKKVERDKSNK